MFGDPINEILFEDSREGRATIWDFLSDAAIRAGDSEHDLPQNEDVVARIATAVNGTSFPPLSVPTQHYPHEWSPNACPEFRGRIFAIARRHALSARYPMARWLWIPDRARKRVQRASSTRYARVRNDDDGGRPALMAWKPQPGQD